MSSSKEVSKWSDDFMFTAEKSTAADGPTAYLLGGPVDPLGQVVACIKMYKGQVVRDLADVTDAERHEALEQIQKTVLTMPLEAVSLHFMVEGVHRGITHQMVRQRTAAFAQESTRFAVKEDLAEATALPPSLEHTLPQQELVAGLRREYAELGLDHTKYSDDEMLSNALVGTALSKDQKRRLEWDKAVSVVSKTYNDLVNDGMPAEEARGLMPTNITTRLNYITNLRSFYDTMSKRVGDQAQFEWRKVIAVMVQAMRKYGSEHYYDVTQDSEPVFDRDADHWFRLGNGKYRVTRSSAWQYDAIVREIKPVEFALGHRAFGANFDRPSRIGERVDAFAAMGVPSSEWTVGSLKHNIPPISPDEWLLDPDSARLSSDLEFDIWGRRVKKGTGFHWDKETETLRDPDGYFYVFGPEGFDAGVVPA